MTEFRYRAFISYSHRDNHWATWLHRSLESYKPPRKLQGQPGLFGPVPKRLTPIFRDRDELPTATDLSNIINQALHDSACLLVICSPTAAASKWVNEEILAFKQLGRENRIFCLIVDGEPYASDHPEWGLKECFPEALRFKLGPDGKLGTERTEPIAADARPGKDGKANAKLKLIAGMLGVGFDALRQREQQRRQRRLAALATAATAGMVVTTGLAYMALLARAEAERQRDTAEETVAFITTMVRVSDPTEARGNSMTAREVLDRGALRIETELAEQPEVQAALMDTIGTVYMNIGLLDRAKPMLESALDRRRELFGESDPEAASTQAHLAEVLRQGADYDAAEMQFRAALASLRRALGDDDAAVADTLGGLGELLVEIGRFDEGETALREALAIRRAIHGDEHTDVARAMEDLGIAISNKGDLEGATVMLEEAVAMQRRVWGDTPHTYLAEALNKLANVLYERGDYARTEDLLREALAMSRILLPENNLDLATSINNVAFVLHDQDEYDQAEAMFRESLAIQADVVGEHHPDYANTLNNLSYVQDDQGDLNGALESKRAAIAIYTELFPAGHRDYADALTGVGALLLRTGELDKAEADVRQGMEMRASIFGTDSTNYANSEVLLAMIFVARGGFDDALGLARAARPVLEAGYPEDHWRRAMEESVEGAALAGLGNSAEGEPLMLRGFGILSNDPGALPVYVSESRRYLYRHFMEQSRPDQAELYAETR
jgi:tetratricopeptide (TPR) repeat protein